MWNETCHVLCSSLQNLQQVCKQTVNKLCLHGLFQVVNKLEQVVKNQLKACWYYQTCYKVVPTRLIQLWCNNMVVTLCCQPCQTVVFFWTTVFRALKLIQQLVDNLNFKVCFQRVFSQHSLITICQNVVEGGLEPLSSNLMSDEGLSPSSTYKKWWN